MNAEDEEVMERKQLILIKNFHPCDESVAAGQYVYLRPTLNFPRPEFCFQSQHLNLTYVMYCSFLIRFQYGQ